MSFQGNQVIPQSVLRQAVHLTAIGAPFTESSFRAMLNVAVRPLYEQRGRVRMAILKFAPHPSTMSKACTSSSNSTKARATRWAKSRSLGRPRSTPPRSLKTGDFKSGDVANFDRVNDGLDKIRKALRRAGYLDSKVTSERAIDDAKKRWTWPLRIEPAAQYTAGKLTIVGLDLNGRGGNRTASGR